MSKNTKPARSFAEEGLEETQALSQEASNAVGNTNNLTNVSGEDYGEFQQVSGNEPIAFYYRTSAPKKTPKQPFKVLAKGDLIKGTYERSYTGGQFNNTTYLIRLETGELTGLPGSGSVKRGMDRLAEGSKVKITYDGMSEIKKGKWAGRDAHNFTILGNKLKVL